MNVMEEKRKQTLVGKVVSSTCDKTITVAVESYRIDPLYGKRVKRTKKYAAHDENNVAKVGDKVSIVASKPISKTKKYVLDKVIEEAIIL